jgi:hypothetical protein
LGTGTIQVKDADDLDLSTQGSLEGWFYIPPHDYASPERHEDYTLMVKGAGSEIAYGLHLSPRADGLHLRFWIDGSGDWGDGVAQYIGIANPPVETGRWYHVVGVWDGKDVRNARLYIDGREQSEGSEANGEWPIFNSSLPLTIGGRTAGWLDMPADARFDEVAIFNRAISGEEVRWHYKNAGTSQTEGGRTPTGS